MMWISNHMHENVRFNDSHKPEFKVELGQLIE